MKPIKKSLFFSRLFFVFGFLLNVLLFYSKPSFLFFLSFFFFFFSVHSYHRFYIELGEHYNSVITASSAEEKEEEE